MNSRTMSLLFASLVLAAVALPAWQAVSSPPAVTRQAPAPEADAGGRATVVWISVDGVRPDYLERGELPFLSKLMREGAVSRQLVPVFPSLTFPSHVSQATGVTAEKHGVTANSFIDKTDWRNHRYPWDSRLMQAEPIWRTAPRQGVRTVVFDWPLSHAQRGANRSDYFGPRFIGGMADEERLQLVIDAWEGDEHDEPLRLLMGYVVGPDKPGHEFGPDASEPVAELEKVDALLANFAEKAVQLWQRHPSRKPNDTFYLLVSTDHGMSNVTHLVNMELLAGIDGVTGYVTSTSGNVGHIYLQHGENEEPNAEVDNARLDAIVARVNKHEYAKAYRRENMPREWGYAHPSRSGDIVVVVDTGYTFSRRPKETPAEPVSNFDGPLGMHGYDVVRNPEMHGMMILWRAPQPGTSPLGGVDLGAVHSLQLHATVARLLGIEPAEGARQDGVKLPDAKK